MLLVISLSEQSCALLHQSSATQGFRETKVEWVVYNRFAHVSSQLKAKSERSGLAALCDLGTDWQLGFVSCRYLFWCWRRKMESLNMS